MAPTCSSNATYFATLNECVPDTLLALPAFTSAILRQLSCAGGVISTAAQLESMRFCTHVTGSLVITIDVPADYSSLFNIAVIDGWCGHAYFG